MQATENFLALCSHCFLYDSNWAERRADQVEHVIEGVEQEKGRKFLRAADGTLARAEDCDRILGSIALISRILELRGQAEPVRLVPVESAPESPPQE